VDINNYCNGEPMEPRKVQKVGYSTLSVSIPMNWAKKRGIKKGDIVT